MNEATGHDDDSTGRDDPDTARPRGEGDTPVDGEGSADDAEAEDRVADSEADDGQAYAEADAVDDQTVDRDAEPKAQDFFADIFDSPAMKALREQQRRLADLFDTPAMKAVREQQRRLADLFDTPAMRAVVEQQRRLARMFDSQGFKALAHQQRRLADLFDTPAMRAMAEQQRRLAELTTGPAFESLHQKNLQVAKLARSPAVQVLANQQRAWKASQTYTLVNQTLSSPAFRNAYLERSRSIAEAFSRVEVDPGWKRVIGALQVSPEVARWANSVANAIEEGQIEATAVQDATEALVESPAMQEALEHAAQSDTTPFEDVVDASANALRAAQSVPEDEERPLAPGLSATVSDADGETFRALMKLWGAGHLVMVVVFAAIVSGQPLVILLTLAALSEITGYSLRDLIEWLGRSKDQ